MALSFPRSWFRRSPQQLLRRPQLETLEDRCVPAGGSTSKLSIIAPPVVDAMTSSDPTNAGTTGSPGGDGTSTGSSGNSGTGSINLPNGIGVFDPNTATWYLRSNLSAGAPTVTPFQYGEPGWIPVWGDWTGDGTKTLGVYDPSTSTFYLKNSNTPGAPDLVIQYGEPGWVPVVGDWTGDGKDTIGVFNPSTATWYLRDYNAAGAPDITPFQFGEPNWTPVYGDWDGDGEDSIGVFDPSTATWYLRNTPTAGAPDYGPIQYGEPGWTPVVGDWSGDGNTAIGVYSPSGTWYLRNSLTQGPPTITPFRYGGAGWGGFFLPGGTSQTGGSGQIPSGSGQPVATPATAFLTAPTTGGAPSVNLTVTASPGSGPALVGTFSIDVDLNHDGQFSGAGELAYTSGTLDTTTGVGSRSPWTA